MAGQVVAILEGLLCKMKSFLDFEGIHAGETIWVLGSGKTLEFVCPQFFADKTVVAANRTYKIGIPHAYVVSNHWVSKILNSSWFITPEIEQVPPADKSPDKPSGQNVVFVPTID